MADGLNQTRRMRIGEVMDDFTLIQHRIHQYQQVTPPPGDYHEAGYGILRQCFAEAQAILATQFAIQAAGNTPEQERQQLQRILLDASARRLRVQRVYLRAVAAVRWANTRNSILRGQSPNASHTAALQQAENTLRAELAAITDQRIVDYFRQRDWAARHYLDEDPPLATIQNWISSQH